MHARKKMDSEVDEEMDHTAVIVIQMQILHRPRVIRSHAYDFLQLTKYMCQKSEICFVSGKNPFGS